FGRSDLSAEDVERVARLAQAHEFVERLPQGYDTLIGERGITLSGGQRQRIAIARALAVDPRILILDDATASVDSTTEAHIRAGLSVISLLTATATALAPPYLGKYALDDAVKGDTGARLVLVVAIFVGAGLDNWGMTYAETYLTGWVGERILADLRNDLFDHL